MAVEIVGMAKSIPERNATMGTAIPVMGVWGVASVRGMESNAMGHIPRAVQ